MFRFFHLSEYLSGASEKYDEQEGKEWLKKRQEEQKRSAEKTENTRRLVEAKNSRMHVGFTLCKNER